MNGQGAKGKGGKGKAGSWPSDLGPIATLVVEQHGAAPACVVGAARWVEERWRHGWGSAGVLWTVPPPSSSGAAEAPAVDPTYIFDLASLTKPVVALLLARLERAGVLSRAERLGEVAPALGHTASAGVSLDLLSAHRAGLEAHVELFVKDAAATQPSPAEAIERAASALRPECKGPAPPAGFAPIYSDLGYILLGAAIEARSGRPLDELVAEQIAAPLGARLGSIDRLRALDPRLDARVAPTEDVAWRGGVLQAVVHDENAWILAGTKTAGHAGLFGDAAAVVALGTAVLDAWRRRDERWLSRRDLEPVLRPRPGGSHAAGFDRKSGPAPSSGRLFGPETFGHLGFTGTSLWIDPDRELVAALLTNRVHPSRDHLAIRAARPAAHDAIVAAMAPGCDPDVSPRS
jgi:serine-type D-Ala-D-Ala carboxypeptidase